MRAVIKSIIIVFAAVLLCVPIEAQASDDYVIDSLNESYRKLENELLSTQAQLQDALSRAEAAQAEAELIRVEYDKIENVISADQTQNTNLLNQGNNGVLTTILLTFIASAIIFTIIFLIIERYNSKSFFNLQQDLAAANESLKSMRLTVHSGTQQGAPPENKYTNHEQDMRPRGHFADQRHAEHKRSADNRSSPDHRVINDSRNVAYDSSGVTNDNRGDPVSTFETSEYLIAFINNCINARRAPSAEEIKNRNLTYIRCVDSNKAIKNQSPTFKPTNTSSLLLGIKIDSGRAMLVIPAYSNANADNAVSSGYRSLFAINNISSSNDYVLKSVEKCATLIADSSDEWGIKTKGIITLK